MKTDTCFTKLWASHKIKKFSHLLGSLGEVCLCWFILIWSKMLSNPYSWPEGYTMKFCDNQERKKIYFEPCGNKISPNPTVCDLRFVDFYLMGRINLM